MCTMTQLAVFLWAIVSVYAVIVTTTAISYNDVHIRYLHGARDLVTVTFYSMLLVYLFMFCAECI